MVGGSLLQWPLVYSHVIHMQEVHCRSGLEIKNRPHGRQEKIGSLFCERAEKNLDEKSTLKLCVNLPRQRFETVDRKGARESFLPIRPTLWPADSTLFMTDQTRKMRAFAGRAFLILAGAALLGSCTTMGKRSEAPGLVHVVLVWLKHPEKAGDRAALVNASRAFQRIRGVEAVQVGGSLPVRRPGVEQNFDLAVIITFRNRDALERYETDPRHQMAAQQVLKPLARRYTVFNVVLE